MAATAAQGLAQLPALVMNDTALLEALGDSRDTVRTAVALALVGAGARVESRLRSFAEARPPGRREAARLALDLIEAQRMIDVADRCYVIRYGEWTPPIPFESIEGLQPPQRIRFRPLVAYWLKEEEDHPRFVIEQEWEGSWYRTGFWIPDRAQRSIIVNASPQLSGVVITVKPGEDGALEGSASTYWDFRTERETALARLMPISCGDGAARD